MDIYNAAPFASNVEEIDDFGYSWSKSSVDENIAYNWIDIEDNNTGLIMINDDSGSIANFNFSFPFSNLKYGFGHLEKNSQFIC